MSSSMAADWHSWNKAEYSHPAISRALHRAIPFSSSDLGPELGIPFHRAVNLNDEIYGNSNSWIGGASPAPFPLPFAGVALDGAFTLRSIAFGRSNVTSGDPAPAVYAPTDISAYTHSNTPRSPARTLRRQTRAGPRSACSIINPPARWRRTFHSRGDAIVTISIPSTM